MIAISISALARRARVLGDEIVGLDRLVEAVALLVDVAEQRIAEKKVLLRDQRQLGIDQRDIEGLLIAKGAGDGEHDLGDAFGGIGDQAPGFAARFEPGKRLRHQRLAFRAGEKLPVDLRRFLALALALEKVPVGLNHAQRAAGLLIGFLVESLGADTLIQEIGDEAAVKALEIGERLVLVEPVERAKGGLGVAFRPPPSRRTEARRELANRTLVALAEEAPLPCHSACCGTP